MKDPSSFGQRVKLVVKLTGAVAIGIPLAGCGVLLCLTIVFIFPGIGLIFASGYPLYRVICASLKQRIQWKDRDRPLFEEDERSRPWNTEE